MSYIILDIEATKVPNHNPWHKESYLCSVGILDQNGVFHSWVFNHRTEAVRNERLMLCEIQRMLDESDLIIGHNIKFDLNWLKTVGLACSDKKIWCTQVAENLIQGQRKVGYKLDQLAQRYDVKGKLDLMAEFWSSGYETDEIPLSVHLPYLEQDLRTTRDIFLRQLPIVMSSGLDKLAELTFEVTQILSDVETRGVAFDIDSAHKYISEYKDKVETLSCRMQAVAGIEFNPNTPAQLSAVLFGGSWKVDGREEYEVTLKDGTVKTKSRKCKVDLSTSGLGFIPPQGCVSKKTGAASVDKNALKLISGKTPAQKEFLQALLEYKKAAKVLSTFVSDTNDNAGLVSKVGKDGRIHPTFNQTVTATGRLSSSDPNGQNLPRKGTSPIKKVFYAKRGVIVNLDLGQIEWRMAAELSRDPVMLYEIKNKVDVHADNAIRFFGAGEFDPDSEEFGKLRTAAKVMTFRLLYGGSANGFYRDQNMPRYSLARWREIVAAFYEKYKGLAAWQQNNVLRANKDGYLRNPSGRFLTFEEETTWEGLTEFSQKQIYNYPVQSCSADIMYLAMYYVNKRVKEAKLNADMVLQVHDSMVFDCTKEDARKLCEIGISTFEELPKLALAYFGWEIDVPLTGDAELGYNYGATKKCPIEKWDDIFSNLDGYLTAD